MQSNGFDLILEKIAQANRTTPAEVREQLQHAMEAALKNPDPNVQAMWASIPRNGEHLTLDEFMGYLIDRNMLLP